jgi:hypothetical protein
MPVLRGSLSLAWFYRLIYWMNKSPQIFVSLA